MATRFFEDYRPGDVFELGAREVSEAEIVAFGKAYDPQYFHTDPDGCKALDLGRARGERLAHGLPVHAASGQRPHEGRGQHRLARRRTRSGG